MPWPWRSSAVTPASRSTPGLWDCHVHILPGLDDGPPDMETAVAMIRMASQHGTTAMVATPHAIDGLYDTTREQVLQALAEVREACAAAGVEMRLLPGQEIALVPDLAARLLSGRLLTYGDVQRAALVEVPSSGLPPYWEQTLFDMAVAGIVPVVAHVERTPLLHDPKLAARAVELGARLQANVRVLASHGSAQRQVMRFIEEGWVACLGSDGHELQGRTPLLDTAWSGGHEGIRRLLAHPAILPEPS